MSHPSPGHNANGSVPPTPLSPSQSYLPAGGVSGANFMMPVGMMPARGVGAMPGIKQDGLDMELYDIFSMASTSFDGDAPSQDYFSHNFPTGQGPSGVASPNRPTSTTSQHSAAAANSVGVPAFSAGRMPVANVTYPWSAAAAAAAASNSGLVSGAAAASSPNMGMPSADYLATTNVPMTDTTPTAASGQPISSPFMLQYAAPSPALVAAGSAAALTPEQQQRLYADFVAGKHLNSFNANPPPAAPLQFQPSNPQHSHAHSKGGTHSGMSSDASDDSDDEDEAPPKGKRGRGVKMESTPASAHFNSPYYKPGSAAEAAAFEAMGGDPNDKERLGKRLARKAELARASRRRKKMYVQDLESKVKKLGLKIEELQAKASSSRSKAPSVVLVDEDAQRKTAQQNIRATMSALLSCPEGVDAAGTARIHDLVRQFVENSRDRQAQVETYLDRVEESLTPGLQAKFAMWGLDQNDDFYSKPGLWTSLMSKEIGLTPTQLAAILAKRPAIHQERKNMAACELMIKELRVNAGQHLRAMHQTMDEIQTVMTPTQLAKFYLVENNEWTMQMLNASLGFSSSSQRAQQQP